MRVFVPSAKRSRSSAARVWTSFGRFLPLDVGIAGLRDERFGFAHREVLRHDVPRDAQLRGLVGEAEQRAGMSHRERTRRQVLADLVGQPQQPDVVGNRRSILPDRLGDLFLGQAEIVGEAAVCLRFLDGIEILALDVLDRALPRRSRSSGMSRTTTGTFSRPARCDARHRRSPATIS